MNHETLSRREAVALKWMCALAVPLRLILIFRYRFDSDEPQHMHVAWAWARGLLQYRDVFDNHMPLFHILSAPMFGAMGDNVRVLYLARLSVLPLYFATLVLLFAIAERLFDRRNALWATALTACFPPFFLGSLEYRTDDLWIVFWFTCLALLVSRVRPMRKMVLAGLALGLAFAVSLKSILFVVAIVTAVVATIRMTRSAFPLSRGTLVRRMAVFSGCALLVPSVVAAYFAWAGAWRQFAYCVLWHNGSAPNDHWWKVFWLVPGVPAIRFLAYRYAAAEGEPDVVRRRLFIFLTASTYLLCVGAIWPVIAAETYLPLYPLAVLLVTPAIVGREVPFRRRVGSADPATGQPARVRSLRLAPVAVAVALLATAVTARVWRDDAHAQVSLIRQILQVTVPSDAVMDLKGESVFRRRPYWLVLESITHRKIRHGFLRDDIAAALVRSGTAVLASDAFPPATSRFVHRNYVPWGRLWVLGRRVPRGVSTVPIPFRIAVPSTYVVVGRAAVVPAVIDGTRVNGGIALNPGWHTLLVDRPVASPIVIWSGVTRSPQFQERLADLRIRVGRRRDVAVAAGE